MRKAVRKITGAMLFGAACLTAVWGWTEAGFPDGSKAVYGEAFRLPRQYDLREAMELPAIADQGSLGTCWAFASLTALETSMPPEIRERLSADHMTLHNSFGLGQNDGGDFSMAMSYLLAWQGPVSEREDPYGDGISPEGLSPVCHVQEIRILQEKDYAAIKQAVLEYGGVQSTLYIPERTPENRGEYYREDTCAYYYPGIMEPNHDVVVVGWDDGYPRENFSRMPDADGAFLCMNSWGEEFGNNGCFYVSYEDSRMGTYAVAYSDVRAPEENARIHQTDLCGWTGQLGYGSSSAWFANVYEAEGEETIVSAGFYATTQNTDYQVYAVRLPESGDAQTVMAALSDSAAGGTSVAEGHLKEAGFYTIPLKEKLPLHAGERFAVITALDSPGTSRPVAVELKGTGRTEHIDIADGEGYISSDGRRWEPVEGERPCNVCLKAYGKIR
ncbi:MAG: peptidase C1 [Lachnospiraceae bacterium]|nr:peptidase C1 [Lachnospiraceae bacterium]